MEAKVRAEVAEETSASIVAGSFGAVASTSVSAEVANTAVTDEATPLDLPVPSSLTCADGGWVEDPFFKPVVVRHHAE